MTDTLGEALPREMARVRDEVMPIYSHPALEGSGAPAIAMMRHALDQAAKALAEGDVVAMLRWHQELKEFDV